MKAGSFGTGGLVPGLVHDAEKQLSRWKVSPRPRDLAVIGAGVGADVVVVGWFLGWCWLFRWRFWLCWCCWLGWLCWL